MNSLARSTCLFLSLAAVSAAFPQADPATIARILDEGKNRNQVMSHLKVLSEDIGSRLSTSRNLDKAYDWTQKMFKQFGCKNVHLEQWGEWPIGFQRGKCSGAMVAPFKRELEFTTPSWTIGTSGAWRGPAVVAPTTMEELKKREDELGGRWIVYRTAPPRPGRGRPGQPAPELTPEMKEAQDLDAALNKMGILGKVIPSRNELVITSGSALGKSMDTLSKDLTITVRKSDMEAIFAQLDANKPVELEFDIQQEVFAGPRKLYNVVAEIPGTDLKNEVVIMGGHLDSWDGPGNRGAADNGTGCSAALEAARILCKVGAKPRRTIRFILFTGEEQGLWGSRGYVETHKAEMDQISCMFIEDGGTNYEGGVYALEPMIPFLQPIADINNAAFPQMPMKIRKVDTMPRGGGSDHVPFNGVGVPGFFWDEVGIVDYDHIHHTQHDRMDLVPRAYMVQSATNNAVATYYLACHPEKMPRQPAAAPPARR